MSKFQPSSFAAHEEELAYLKEQGFIVNPLNKKVDSLEEIWAYQEEMQKLRDKVAYPVDGLVVKLNDNKIASALGAVGKAPRAWCAIKFPAEEKPTLLQDITWQVGRTGRLTPVANLKPVLLSGSTVTRATLHNYKEFCERGLHQGDTLIVRKAGDIIPEVVALLPNLRLPETKVFYPPAVCPVCTASLEKTETGVDLVCPNSVDCPVQIKLRLSYFASRSMANIAGLSEKIIERFMDEFQIRDIPDLYTLDWEKVAELEGFGQKSAQNLKRAVEKSKTLPEAKFFAALGIEGIGEETAKLILDYLYAKESQDSPT